MAARVAEDPPAPARAGRTGRARESQADRQRLGKPAIGSVVVTAAQRGSTIVVEVEDDGAGIDIGAVRRAAAERRLASEAELAAMSHREALRLIFTPGLSTRHEVT